MIDKDQPEIETKTLKTIKLPLYDNIIKNIKFIALMQKFLGFLFIIAGILICVSIISTFLEANSAASLAMMAGSRLLFGLLLVSIGIKLFSSSSSSSFSSILDASDDDNHILASTINNLTSYYKWLFIYIAVNFIFIFIILAAIFG